MIDDLGLTIDEQVIVNPKFGNGLMATVNVVRRRSSRALPGIRFQIDYWLLLAVAGLLVVGMLMVYSSTFDFAE